MICAGVASIFEQFIHIFHISSPFFLEFSLAPFLSLFLCLFVHDLRAVGSSYYPTPRINKADTERERDKKIKRNTTSKYISFRDFVLQSYLSKYFLFGRLVIESILAEKVVFANSGEMGKSATNEWEE